MKLKNTILVLLAAAILAAGVFTIVSADTNSLLEFFGFKKPTQTPTPAAASVTEPKSQKTPKPDADPFGTGNSSGSTGLGTSDWDDPLAGIDPALIEWDEPDVETKSGQGSNIYNDPYANSFSADRFDSVPSFGSDNSGQSESKVYQPYPDNPYITPTRSLYFYQYQNYPVFRPMHVMPCTGFPTGRYTEIKENISYAKTNMSLSIPTLNVNEDIVIVPLVDDNFPVESLGRKIGLLEGSGPSDEDLFVLAGHNHLNTQDQGPFAALSALKSSDLIFVRGANDNSRTFVVYANEKFSANDIDGVLSYVRPGCMILITCEDESVDGGYLNRRVVFAEAKNY